ncbi:MAG: MFS transporter [Desulfobacterales bacterium CG07_land_8_20_14_0_80_52_14]|nr:MAG: MFS transporter [Desulfobacterales bacterium CG07_land_8_20_14_0_80_52_14]
MEKNEKSLAATLWVIAAVQFLTPFMFSAVGVALPTIGREFSASAVHLGLIEMVYILGVALFLLPMGRFADIHGRKRIFLAGNFLMTLATVALSLAPNIEFLIIFRFFQGVCAAMITSTSLAILTSVFPKERLGRAMGVVVSGVYLGVSAGPTLAGLMIEYLNWRWIFYSAVPVELMTLIFALTQLEGEWTGSKGETFDWAGSILYMTALFGIILGIVETHNFPAARWLACGGMGVFSLFLVYETRISSPLLPLKKVISNKMFAFSNLATWLNYAASFGIMFFFSIYLQVIKGVSPKNTGLVLIIQPLLQAVCAPFAGRMSDIYRPAYIATAGMVLCTLGIALAALLNATSHFPMIYGILLLMGLGFGFFSTPNNTAIMGSVGPGEYGMASSLIATMRTTGMLTSMTLITVLLSHFLGDRSVTIETGKEFVLAMKTAMTLFSIMGIFAIGLSLGRIPRWESRKNMS